MPHYTLTPPEIALAFAILAPAVFFGAMALGRWMKRYCGVKLGTLYMLLCGVLAIYVPVEVLHIHAYRERFDANLQPAGHWIDLERELLAAIILLSAFFLIALIRRYLWEYQFEKKRGTEVPQFLREVVALTVFFTAVIVVLSGIYDQTVPGLLAGSGILAVILGFAMQDLLGNIISGIALEIGKPFRPGDWLAVDNQYGRVVELNWRSVRLCTNDDIYLDIPNNQIVRGTIRNLSYSSRQHAIRTHVGLEYHLPPNTVKDALVRAASTATHVMRTPAPKAYLKEFGDSAIVYEVKFFIEDHARLNDSLDAVHTNIWYELKRAGMSIPFPIRTLQIQRPHRKIGHNGSEAKAALRSQEIFRDLDDSHVATLVDSSQQLRFGRGERIIGQGEQGESMFLLVHGSAEVFVGRTGEVPTQVATLRSGACFGEMSLLTGEERSATVVAKTDCEVIEIGKAVFGTILDREPRLVERFSELLAERRLNNEGILATTANVEKLMAKQRDYKANFLAKLSKFFEI